MTGAGATGSEDSEGIGQAVSILFAREGARVLLVDRDQENAEVILATIKEEGGEAWVFVGDVTSNADCQETAQAAVARYGKLNVLVNNVGISGPGGLDNCGNVITPAGPRPAAPKGVRGVPADIKP